MAQKLNIVGLAGSLRKGSFNMGLLRVAEEVLPSGATLKIMPIGGLSLYNQDLEQPLPTAVQVLKDAVAASDGLLISTPEYNYSVPGVLKNAIDWLSRPYGQNSVEDKPVAIMGSSVGMLGSSRAQYHLRQSFVFLNGHVMNRPEIMVPMAGDKFDAAGTLTDEKTKEKLRAFLEAFVTWIGRVGEK